MDPVVWGPHGWNFLHYVSLDYPYNPTLEDKTKYKAFIESFRDVLPCEVCRKHFRENMEGADFSVILESKNSFFRWVVDMHNIVNKKNGKREWSYKEALHSLLQIRENKPLMINTPFKLFVVFLLVSYKYFV